MRLSLFVLPTMIAIVFMAGATASGQSTATFQGTVSDEKGAVVPNATVIVRNQATGIEPVRRRRR